MLGATRCWTVTCKDILSKASFTRAQPGPERTKGHIVAQQTYKSLELITTLCKQASSAIGLSEFALAL